MVLITANTVKTKKAVKSVLMRSHKKLAMAKPSKAKTMINSQVTRDFLFPEGYRVIYTHTYFIIA